MVVLVAPGAASAASITVETTSDVTVNDGECSLREAITSANMNSNASEPGCTQGTVAQDIISLPPGTYTLLGASGDDANLSGDLDYTGGGQIAIEGPSTPNGVPAVTIDAPPSDRILDVPLTGATNHQIFINAMTLTDGRALGGNTAEGDGGAIRIADINVDLGIFSTRITGSQAGRNGGAVSFDSADPFGNIEVSDSEFSGNSAGTQVATGSGGAFFSGVALNDPIVQRSTFAGNVADGAGGAFALNASTTSPVIKFRNSTLSGNSAEAGGSAVGFLGGGNTPDVFFEFSTIAGNTSPLAHGALESAGAGQSFYLRASIISANTGAGAPSNCSGPGPFNSQGHNVESANTCSLPPAAPNLINTNPLLAPLATSTVVGATQTMRTHGLFDGSAALDFIPRAGPDSCAPSLDEDQRAIARPTGPTALCDAGAFEGSVGPAPVPPAVPVVPAPVQPPVTTPAASKKCKKGTKRKVVKGKVTCVKKKRKKK